MINEQETSTASAATRTKLDTWPKRRKMLWTVVLFCMAVIVYCLGFNPTLGDVAIKYSFILLGTALIGYVFGAVLDDHVSNILGRKN